MRRAFTLVAAVALTACETVDYWADGGDVGPFDAGPVDAPSADVPGLDAPDAPVDAPDAPVDGGCTCPEVVCQTGACSGDAMSCEYTPVPNMPAIECGEGGTCVDGACTEGPVTCGDEWRHRGDEEREACDDGNDDLGDACSPTCVPTAFPVARRDDEIDFPPGPRVGVAVDGRGYAAYVWTADIRSEPGAEVRIRSFDEDGIEDAGSLAMPISVAAGLGVGVNPHPVVAGLDEGWVVVWEDRSVDGSDLGIAYALVRADGTVRTRRRANTRVLLRQHEPAVAAVQAGGFVIAWTDESGILEGASPRRVVVRAFDADGVPTTSELVADADATVRQSEPSLAADADGVAVVAWTELGGEVPRLVRARRYASGEWTDATALEVDAAESHSPAVAALEGGEFVVAWTSRENDFGGDIRARLVHVSDPPLDGSTIEDIAATEEDETDPAVVLLNDDEYLVAWTLGRDRTGIAFAGSPGATLPPEAMVPLWPFAASTLGEVSAARGPDGIWLSFGIDEMAPVSGPIRAVWGYLLPPD